MMIRLQSVRERATLLFDKNRVEYLIPFIHFVLTFFLERIIFRFEGNWDIWLSTPRNSYISNTAESVLVYVISKIFAGIIIALLWKLVFAIIRQRIPKHITGMFLTIFLLGLFIGMVLYPSNFGLEIDNYTLYCEAIRFLPTYWWSIFTGTLYAGCLMVIPHPFSIFVFQWLLLVAVTAYIYCGVDQIWNGTKAKYAVFIFLLLPESYYVIFNAYRNDIYTILCLYYFSYLFFKAKRGKKSVSLKEMIFVAILSGFLMIWRSEGILIGLAGILFLVLFAYELQWKKLLLFVLVFLCAYTGLSKVQSIGIKKYYGQDYMILNTTSVLCSIFNQPEAVLQYEGAEEDIAAIEAVVPVEVLKELSMTGYRSYNYTMGRADFNQSLASDEVAEAYMSAYYRIVAHNLENYLDVQINKFYESLSLDGSHTTYSYTGDSNVAVEYFDYSIFRQGRDEVRETFLTERWKDSRLRTLLYPIVSWVITVWQEMWTISGINTLLHGGVILGDVLILMVELARTFSGVCRKHLAYFLVFAVVLAEMTAVFLFMPEGRAAYLYPVLYTSYLLIYFYFIDMLAVNEAD